LETPPANTQESAETGCMILEIVAGILMKSASSAFRMSGRVIGQVLVCIDFHSVFSGIAIDALQDGKYYPVDSRELLASPAIGRAADESTAPRKSALF